MLVDVRSLFADGPHFPFFSWVAEPGTTKHVITVAMFLAFCWFINPMNTYKVGPPSDVNVGL